MIWFTVQLQTAPIYKSPPTQAQHKIAPQEWSSSYLTTSTGAVMLNDEWFVGDVSTLVVSHPGGWVASRGIVQPRWLWVWRYNMSCKIRGLIRWDSSAFVCVWSSDLNWLLDISSTAYWISILGAWNLHLSDTDDIPLQVLKIDIWVLVRPIVLLHIAAFPRQYGKAFS